MSAASSPPSGPSRASLADAPPGAWEPLYRVAVRARRPLERFLHIEAASGVLLLVATALALAWANSPWAASYEAIWRLPLGLRVGGFAFERTLAWFVDDVLMTIFFFVVGLEIRRELHAGELSEPRRAALPVVGALGGMVVPAAIYLALVSHDEGRAGWGIPMATDIAFAVGVLALLGDRAPPALRVLLLALAVIDDLGAIVVIALFYSSGLSASGLLVAGVGLAGLFAMRSLGVRAKLAYLLPAGVVWAGVYAAGIHPTIAGVIVGFATPVRAWLGAEGFVDDTRRELDQLEGALARLGPGASNELALALQHVETARREAIAPAESLIHTLHPWVAFGVMPIFAFANAGVRLSGGELGPVGSQIALGAAVGLVLGKPLGVFGACALAIRVGLARLPVGLTYAHLGLLGVVAGIGFTMALFVARLAFPGEDALAAAKLGVLAASGIAGLLALALGRAIARRAPGDGGARTVDEAEQSTER